MNTKSEVPVARHRRAEQNRCITLSRNIHRPSFCPSNFELRTSHFLSVNIRDALVQREDLIRAVVSKRSKGVRRVACIELIAASVPQSQHSEAEGRAIGKCVSAKRSIPQCLS
jgi:hypothetical protein